MVLQKKKKVLDGIFLKWGSCSFVFLFPLFHDSYSIVFQMHARYEDM